MIEQLIEFITTHKATLTALAAWFVHVNLPALKAIYPYLCENGGILGVARNFVFGQTKQPQPKETTP